MHRFLSTSSVRRGIRRRGPIASLATAGLAAAALGAPAAAAAAPGHTSYPTNYGPRYHFTTLNDQADPTFNQLLGINDHGVIAGYFGSGNPGHPNRGYELSAPYGQGNYSNLNFPGATQTQVTGLNNHGSTVGFYADPGGDNFGWARVDGRFIVVINPNQNAGATHVEQLLGINNRDLAVGFYTDAQGVNHGYTYNVDSNRFHSVTVPGDTNVTATGINQWGDVAGFASTASGTVESFLTEGDGTVLHLMAPGAKSTEALGVNNLDEVVGVETDTAGQMHGFVWTHRHGFRVVDDPNGVGTTTINGLNNRGDLVGFYVDGAGNTDGFLAQP